MSKKSKFQVSKSKVYILTISALLVVAGVTSYAVFFSKSKENHLKSPANVSQDKDNNAYANISNNDIQRSTTDVDMLWNEQDPYYGFNKDPVVALVHVDSIDGGRTYSPISEQYVFPQTVGRMTIREVYKGDLKSGEQISYARPGGIVFYDQYWNSLNKQQQDKILYLNNGKKPTDKKYIQEKFTDDIDIEVGKAYVVLLIPKSSKNGKSHEYLIDGGEYGLREIKGSGKEKTVLNNKTKQWDNLSSIVKRG